MKYRDYINSKEYKLYKDGFMFIDTNKVSIPDMTNMLDSIEDRVGEILNELDTLEGNEREDVDIDTVRKLVRQLKDDLY